MLRWLSEFRNPSLKCVRLGHDWKEEKRTGYVRPWTLPGHYFRAVVVRIKQQREICQRCKILHPEKGEWKTFFSAGIQVFSSSLEEFDKLDRGEFVKE